MISRKKGFVKILEAVLASVIILSSLSFFISITSPGDGWDKAVSELRAQDALGVAVSSGALQSYVKLNDQSGLRNYMRNMFAASTDFSVEISGIPNPVTYVSCSCTDAQVASLKANLAPLAFNYKGRNMEIRVNKIEDTANLPEETNVLFFYDFQELPLMPANPSFMSQYQNNKARLDSFLESGGTIFLYDDLTQAEAEDATAMKIFGVSWKAAGNNQDKGKFLDTTDAARSSFNIAEYYANLRAGNTKTDMFSSFDKANNINQIDEDLSTVIESSNNKFSLVKTSEGIVNGNGRSVWFPKNDNSQGISDLFKATIMWASGERFKMDGSAIKVSGRESKGVSILVYDTENYESKLTTWNIF